MIQRRLASTGLDVATSVLRSTCQSMADSGCLAKLGGDGSLARYRIAASRS
ncbi:MAG: hypothetical protein ABEJ27_07115 [Halodesulfurarchaeum sp.]